jgi:hypothetical protein
MKWILNNDYYIFFLINTMEPQLQRLPMNALPPRRKAMNAEQRKAHQAQKRQQKLTLAQGKVSARTEELESGFLSQHVPTRTVKRGKFPDPDNDGQFFRTKIEEGTTKASWAPGMEDIAKSLVAMQKDLKVIRSATTPQGAQDWIQKNNKKGYSVHTAQITDSPTPEVLVTNLRGEVMMINGKKLVSTKHHERVLQATLNRGRLPQQKLTVRQ